MNLVKPRSSFWIQTASPGISAVRNTNFKASPDLLTEFQSGAFRGIVANGERCFSILHFIGKIGGWSACFVSKD